MVIYGPTIIKLRTHSIGIYYIECLRKNQGRMLWNRRSTNQYPWRCVMWSLGDTDVGHNRFNRIVKVRVCNHNFAGSLPVVTDLLTCDLGQFTLLRFPFSKYSQNRKYWREVNCRANANTSTLQSERQHVHSTERTPTRPLQQC
jgi:hypothetical protein